MPGSFEAENRRIRRGPIPEQYRRETLTDYSAMLRYIRTDKSTPDFLEDLRDNKTHLLAYFNEIFEDRENLIHDEPYGMKQIETKYDIVRYLDTMLQLHVFDMDPYHEDRDSIGSHEGVCAEFVQKITSLDTIVCKTNINRYLRHKDSLRVDDVRKSFDFRQSLKQAYPTRKSSQICIRKTLPD